MNRFAAHLRRLVPRLSAQAGFALATSLGLLGFFSITGTTVFVYSTSGHAEAARSATDEFSFSLSEAGLNNAMAVLANPARNALDSDTLPSSEATASSMQYEGGTAKWWGTLDQDSAVWNVTAVGLYDNPTGPGTGQIRRTLRARVPVTPVAPQDLDPNNQAWQYMFATRTGNACDMTLNNHVTGSTRLYTNGNLCISNNADYLGEALVVKGNLSLGNGSDVGAPTSMATRVETHVGGASGCLYHTGSWHNPCTDVDHVYGKMSPPNWVVGVNQAPPTIAAPSVDLAGWYEHAVPGPSQGCTTWSGVPPVFDDDYPNRNSSVLPIFDLTPVGSSYTCRVGAADNPIGELSWNNLTKTLTVDGVIFIDGSAKTTGLLNQYNGQGTLYLSGTFSIEGSLCGGILALSCDFSLWNPNSEMLSVVTGANGGTAPYGVTFANNAQFQGALFSSSAIYLGNWARSDGPMVATTIVLSNHVSTDPFPFITTVPPGMPGNPNVYAQPNAPELFAG